MKARYRLNPDKEILEILQAASKSKQVISLQQLLTCWQNFSVICDQGITQLLHSFSRVVLDD
jgi:hypothetical protein